MIKLGQNIASLSAQRSLSRISNGLGEVYSRLSSGQRITKASDDAAGLAIATSLNVRSRVNARAVQNLNDGISAISVIEGALDSLGQITTRLAELAQQAASGSFSAAQRKSLDNEGQALSREYSRIINSTEFNGNKLLDGSAGGIRLQGGFGIEGSLAVDIGGARSTGTFAPATTVYQAASTTAFSVIDVNSDGFLDLVGTGANIVTHLGTGSGAFQQVLTSSTLNFSASPREFGDVNGDGHLDVVGIEGPNFVVGYGDGSGYFTAQGKVAPLMGATSFAVGDINGDGRSDIVGWNPGANLNHVLLSDGTGGFSATTHSISTGTGAGVSPRLVDLNNDGNLDLVNIASGVVRTSLGNGAGGFAAALLSGASGPGGVISHLNFGDINGDGVLDLVAGQTGSSEVRTWLGDGDGTFSSMRTYSQPNLTSGASFADIDGDGVLDLGVLLARGRGINLMIGSGDGTFSPSHTVDGNTLTFGDINGDGAVDIISWNGLADISIANTVEGVNPLLPFSLKTQIEAKQALPIFTRRIEQIATQRGKIGASTARIGVAVRNLQSQGEGLKAAESRILDADIATESAELIRLNILQQTSNAILRQANLQPEIALRLLR